MFSVKNLIARRGKCERMYWEHQALEKERVEVNISAKLLKKPEE